ncbi:hypothetical protein GOP47_0021234 [Adiantum capillus-veneris]|uniref:Uncharacterized protein n=1 Tax=Adiantum capillus-veneris TaxID=13818 RepID=A0A9D4UAQ5_ADICA|nr:hypothetical protein GOP47_0021234 [Adiantum capillus-veneris]
MSKGNTWLCRCDLSSFRHIMKLSKQTEQPTMYKLRCGWTQQSGGETDAVQVPAMIQPKHKDKARPKALRSVGQAKVLIGYGQLGFFPYTFPSQTYNKAHPKALRSVGQAKVLIGYGQLGFFPYTFPSQTYNKAHHRPPLSPACFTHILSGPQVGLAALR